MTYQHSNTSLWPLCSLAVLGIDFNDIVGNQYSLFTDQSSNYQNVNIQPPTHLRHQHGTCEQWKGLILWKTLDKVYVMHKSIRIEIVESKPLARKRMRIIYIYIHIFKQNKKQWEFFVNGNSIACNCSSEHLLFTTYVSCVTFWGWDKMAFCRRHLQMPIRVLDFLHVY